MIVTGVEAVAIKLEKMVRFKIHTVDFICSWVYVVSKEKKGRVYGLGFPGCGDSIF